MSRRWSWSRSTPHRTRPSIPRPITTVLHFSSKDPAFRFTDFYRRLSDRGMMIYPGKLATVDTIRVGRIGRLFEIDMDNYALYINLTGLAVILVGCIGLVVRAFRHWRKGLLPLSLIGLGLVITGFPPAYRLIVPIDLGPREQMVDGERHITLTGWDRTDYALLGSKRDVAVLQMANPDVTDLTLERLRGMSRLKELDLNNTKITDAGLVILKELPALTALRLKNTKITDKGFQEHLGEKALLMELDLTGTEVSRETFLTWKKTREGRRGMR